jgi:hypothetical protein
LVYHFSQFTVRDALFVGKSGKPRILKNPHLHIITKNKHIFKQILDGTLAPFSLYSCLFVYEPLVRFVVNSSLPFVPVPKVRFVVNTLHSINNQQTPQ